MFWGTTYMQANWHTQIRHYSQPFARISGVLGNVKLQARYRFAAENHPLLYSLQKSLAQNLPASPLCFDLKGHGGLKGAIRVCLACIRQYKDCGFFVYRTDGKTITHASGGVFSSFGSYACATSYHPNAPSWLKERTFVNLTPKMTEKTYISERRKAHEMRHLPWKIGGLKQCLNDYS